MGLDERHAKLSMLRKDTCSSELEEPDSAEDALDELILQIHQTKAASRWVSRHSRHIYHRRGVYTRYAKLCTQRKKRVSRSQTRQTKLQRSNSTRRTTKRRLIIRPTPSSLPPPMSLSSSHLLPSLLVNNPQSAPLPLQRPRTPLRLQPPIELRNRTTTQLVSPSARPKQSKKRGGGNAYGGTNLRPSTPQPVKARNSTLTSDPAALSQSPSQGAWVRNPSLCRGKGRVGEATPSNYHRIKINGCAAFSSVQAQYGTDRRARDAYLCDPLRLCNPNSLSTMRRATTPNNLRLLLLLLLFLKIRHLLPQRRRRPLSRRQRPTRRSWRRRYTTTSGNGGDLALVLALAGHFLVETSISIAGFELVELLLEGFGRGVGRVEGGVC